MVGVTPQIMREGSAPTIARRSPQPAAVRADAHRVDADGQDSGRDRFHRDVRSVAVWVKTSGLINPRYWSNLPAGEVFTTPASVDGRFVCDGTAGDYFNATAASTRPR